MLSGVVGVPVGSILSVKLRPKFARSDPIICGAGLVIASIFLCIAIFTCNKAFILAFVLIFFGEIALNLNWSIVADILLVSLFYYYFLNLYEITFSQNFCQLKNLFYKKVTTIFIYLSLQIFREKTAENFNATSKRIVPNECLL